MKRRGGVPGRGSGVSHPFRQNREKDGARSGQARPAEGKPGARAPLEPQIVEIEKAIYGGDFLARVEGKAVFVPNALPGEQALVRIVESKLGYATAEVDEIVAAAPERIVPACPYFGACGGCHYQHTDYETQLALKQAILRETLQRGGVKAPAEIAVLAGEPWAYRNRIRLAFDSAGRPGYRGRRSHEVVPVSECPIAAPLLMDAAKAAAEILLELAWPMGPAEISLFCNADQTSLLASAFTSHAEKGRFDDWMRALAERVPALVGAELIAQRPVGKQLRTVREWGWGAVSLAYRAAGFDYRVDRGAFFQVNRWLVDALLERVTAGHQGKLAWDLYAGVGLFARKITETFERVVAVESAPAATTALEENLRGTTGSVAKGETLPFLRRNLRGERPDLIVVDPPRTGLGAEVTALLGEISAPALVYVSCDPATLARDLKALIGSGYRIESVELADMFPQTFHLETLVQLRRG